MKPSDALRINREAIRSVVEAHRAGNVRVFGSVVQGSAFFDSDPETPQGWVFLNASK